MQLPLHSLEEAAFVVINLRNLQTRHLAPRFGGVVAVLKVFGS